MSFFAPISSNTTGQLSLTAHLLLTRPITRDIDLLAATFLSNIGEHGAAIQAARKWQDGSKLALRLGQKTAMIAASDVPLSAQHFLRALPPFCPPAQRAAKMTLIGHHEAFVTLRLKTKPEQNLNAPETFLQAVLKLAQNLPVSGMLWGPNGQLHQVSDIAQMRNTDSNMSLLLAPEFTTTGPRRLPVIRFAGARDVLGFALELHLLETQRQLAIDAGLAFATAAQRNPLLRNQGSFSHAGLDFRIAYSDDRRTRVTLIPVQRMQVIMGDGPVHLCAENTP